jgi:hypothetical protein
VGSASSGAPIGRRVSRYGEHEPEKRYKKERGQAVHKISETVVTSRGSFSQSSWGPTLLLQIAVLVLLVFPFVSATFRDNDQATILGAAWQIAHHQAPFLHAVFYNFDKQWGVFLALSWLYWLFPHADPVLAANMLLVILASLAWISLGFRMGRVRDAPLPLSLPILLSPVLILYMPYLGTAWFSLALLLLAFFFVGNRRSKLSLTVGLFLVVAAAACRGDVALAIPALALSQESRFRPSQLVRQPLPWLLGLAAVLPVLVGKLMAGSRIPDTNPLSFDPKSYFGFLLFGLTPAVIGILLLEILVFGAFAARKRRFRIFYLCLAIAPLIPLGFYSLQQYTLRYFFLTIASVLFVASSRRSVWLYRSVHHQHLQKTRRISAALISLTILPWLIGFKIPVLIHPRLTITDPTRFPTGDGEFPMYAYLGFQGGVLFKDHLAIDHNQKIWLASKSVSYDTCSDGTVPFLITPMSNFIEFAIRLQHKEPKPIDYMAESPCGLAYVDVRSIVRGYRPTTRDGAFFEDQVVFASTTHNGQLIARIDSKGQRTSEAGILEKLCSSFGQRNVEIFTGTQLNFSVQPGLRYAVFSKQPCQIRLDSQPVAKTAGLIQATWSGSLKGPFRAEANCPAAGSGWIRTTLPPYMGL